MVSGAEVYHRRWRTSRFIPSIFTRRLWTIIVPPGETAHIPVAAMPEPAHLRDQLALYESFGFHGLPFAPGDLEGPTTTQTLTLP